jgi:hypothetical protein
MEILNGVKDLLIGVSALCTAIFAYLALREWKRKKLGEHQITMAIKGLKLTNSLKEEIMRVRDRATHFYTMVFPEDYVITGIIGGNKLPEDSSFETKHNRISQIMRYMVGHGLKDLMTLRKSLDSHTILMEALTGEVIRRKTDSLLVRVNTLVFNFRKYLEMKYDDTKEEDAMSSKVEDIVFSHDGDDFSSGLLKEVEAVRKEYRKIIRRA